MSQVSRAVGFKPRPRRPISVTPQAEATSPGGPRLPLRIEAETDGVDLAEWGASRREEIDRLLDRHGGVLFRGFRVGREAGFQRFVEAQSGSVLDYTERSSPRSRIAGNVFTSTDHPPDQEIYLHNEQSYNLVFPRKIAFHCRQAAVEGGATPLADVRRVFERLTPAVRDRLIARGYRYVRNFGRGLGLSWQEAFQSDDRDDLERYCRDHQIETEWLPGGVLRTAQTRRVAARHPRTGLPTWFNHLTFFHVTTLPPALREALLASFADDELPNNTFYGDGAPLEPEVLDELHRLYDEERVSFAWREGDVLLLDNMLTAHGREAFRGPRRVVAAMAAPCAWRDLAGVETGDRQQGGFE